MLGGSTVLVLPFLALLRFERMARFEDITPLFYDFEDLSTLYRNLPSAESGAIQWCPTHIRFQTLKKLRGNHTSISREVKDFFAWKREWRSKRFWDWRFNKKDEEGLHQYNSGLLFLYIQRELLDEDHYTHVDKGY